MASDLHAPAFRGAGADVSARARTADGAGEFLRHRRQDFNPFGQSVGEANWNDLATFDPRTATWRKLGLANTATPLAPGFRGSTSSALLPLKPDRDGRYTKASYLTAGGVLLPSPGSYFATSQSSITTVDITGGRDRVTQKKRAR